MVEYTCPKCKHVFHHKGTYLNHQKTDCVGKPRVFRTKEYKCDQCPMEFNRPDHLASHKKTHARQAAKKAIADANKKDINTTAVTINGDTANSTNMFGNNVKGDIVIGDAVKNQTNIYIVGNLFSYISPMKLYNLNESEMRSVFYS